MPFAQRTAVAGKVIEADVQQPGLVVFHIWRDEGPFELSLPATAPSGLRYHEGATPCASDVLYVVDITETGTFTRDIDMASCDDPESAVSGTYSVTTATEHAVTEQLLTRQPWTSAPLGLEGGIIFQPDGTFIDCEHEENGRWQVAGANRLRVGGGGHATTTFLAIFALDVLYLLDPADSEFPDHTAFLLTADPVPVAGTPLVPAVQPATCAETPAASRGVDEPDALRTQSLAAPRSWLTRWAPPWHPS